MVRRKKLVAPQEPATTYPHHPLPPTTAPMLLPLLSWWCIRTLWGLPSHPLFVLRHIPRTCHHSFSARSPWPLPVLRTMPPPTPAVSDRGAVYSGRSAYRGQPRVGGPKPVRALGTAMGLCQSMDAERPRRYERSSFLARPRSAAGVSATPPPWPFPPAVALCTRPRPDPIPPA